MSHLSIIADENIPALDALFGDLGTIKKLPGRTMSADDLRDADILLVRSVTKVNAALLTHSKIQFVGTCTIGTDHLDKAFFETQNIQWSAAPGCNAGGVVQYALAAMATYCPDWANKTVGIIGCGNVGGRLYRTLKALGVKLIVADPHKNTQQISELTTLDKVLGADIICVHTPLIIEGEEPTLNIINANNLPLIKPDALLISAGRGEVIDNFALFKYLQSTPSLQVVLDVWAEEPNIYTPLMPLIRCGTPHIAGYSFEGKLNGSLMIFEALAKHLGLPQEDIAARLSAVQKNILGEATALNATTINEAVLKSYNLKDDHALIAGAIESEEPMATAFDKLRKNYWQRRELGHYFCDDNPAIRDFLELVNGVKK